MEVLKQLTKAFSDLSIFAIQADAAACGHYRVVYPLEFLRRGGARVTIANSFSLQDLYQYDVILAQRQHNPYFLQTLREASFLGKTLVYEIDDNVHAVHANSPAYSAYRPGGDAVHGVKRFIEASDGLFTTSAELASQYSIFSKRTWVLPNQIDFGIRDWESPVERHPDLKDKVVIGWMGSITHQDDYMPIKHVVKSILQKYPHTMFCLVSAYSTMDIFLKELDLPTDRVVKLEPVDFDKYPQLAAQFDIGLVPVVNSTFNRAKSDLKCLEYLARKVPYVASKLAPYVRFHQETQGQFGYIADTQEEWIDAISRLVEDEADRKNKSECGFEYVKQERSGANNAWRWAEAFRECKTLKFSAPEAERKYVVHEKPGRNEPCPCGAKDENGRPIKYKKHCFPSWG